MIEFVERQEMENRTRQSTKRTLAGEIVFLMLSLPMGLLYFVLTVVGLSVGIGTLAIWIGLPILFGMLYMLHLMATIERNLVRSLLHIPHPDQPYERVPGRGFLRRFGSLLRDPYTWTGMIYMLSIKLPLGILSFTLTLTLLILSATLTLLPLVYLINLFINSILLASGVPSAQTIFVPYFLEIHGYFDPLMFARSFAGVPLGLLFSYITLLTLRGLASFSGILANAMLGPGATLHYTQPHTLNYVSPRRAAEQGISLD